MALLNGMAYLILKDEMDDARFHSEYVLFKAMEDSKPVTKTFKEYKKFLKTTPRRR